MTQFDILLNLLRLGISDITFSYPENDAMDWDNLLDNSAKQGVMGWVWEGINKLPKECRPPRQQMINWGLSVDSLVKDYTRQRDVLLKLVHVCESNSMRVLLLKGHGLSVLYPKPEYRFSSDIDIYLFSDYEKGNLVLANNKYQFGGRHSMFTFEGESVENHITFIHTTTRIQKKIERYLESTLNNAHRTDYGYYELEPMAYLVFLLMHSLSHMDSVNVISLKNILDFYMFLKASRNVIPPQEFSEKLKELFIADAFELMLCLSEWISGNIFDDYHFCNIPLEDVERAKNIIIGRTALPVYSPQMKQRERVKIRISRHNEMKWFYRYSPRKINDRIIAGVRQEISLSVQYLLKIKNGGFREGIKNRWCKMK